MCVLENLPTEYSMIPMAETEHWVMVSATCNYLAMPSEAINDKAVWYTIKWVYIQQSSPTCQPS